MCDHSTTTLTVTSHMCKGQSEYSVKHLTSLYCTERRCILKLWQSSKDVRESLQKSDVTTSTWCVPCKIYAVHTSIFKGERMTQTLKDTRTKYNHWDVWTWKKIFKQPDTCNCFSTFWIKKHLRGILNHTICPFSRIDPINYLFLRSLSALIFSYWLHL